LNEKISPIKAVSATCDAIIEGDPVNAIDGDVTTKFRAGHASNFIVDLGNSTNPSTLIIPNNATNPNNPKCQE
jgi:hypothetical protein